MKVYIAVCNDRHIDPEATVHRTREQAIAYARDYMVDHVAAPDYLEEEEIEGRWTMRYGEEEDNAFVVAAELGDPE